MTSRIERTPTLHARRLLLEQERLRLAHWNVIGVNGDFVQKCQNAASPRSGRQTVNGRPDQEGGQDSGRITSANTANVAESYAHVSDAFRN